MKWSVLCPHQPDSAAVIRLYGRAAADLKYRGLWAGQSFQIESHVALATLMSASMPVGIGTALAALRSPYDAALQARSLAAILEQPVTVAYGAADPGFVAQVRGAPLTRPASYVTEYVRLVRGLLNGEVVTSGIPGLEMRDAYLPVLPANQLTEIGAGVLRPTMARRISAVAQCAVTWLTPITYLQSTLLPALWSEGAARVVAMVHVAVERTGRNPYLLSQVGCGNHLKHWHYSDMLNRAGVRNHPSDIASGARNLVDAGVFVYGTPEQIVEHLLRYGDLGVDEVVLNVTSVASVYGDETALKDLGDIARFVPQAQPCAPNSAEELITNA